MISTTSQTIDSKIPFYALGFTALFWGGSWIAAKLAVGEIPPFTIATLRFSVVVLILAPYYLSRPQYKEENIDRKSFPLLLGMGLSGIVSYNAFFLFGLTFTTASNAVLIIGATPTISAVMAAIFLKEKLNIRKILGFIVALTGVATIVVLDITPTSDYAPNPLLGNFLILGGSFSWAIYSILSRNLMTKHSFSSLGATFISTVFGVVILFPLFFFEEPWEVLPTLNVPIISEILYLAIFATVFGFVFYNYGIKALGVGKAVIFTNFVPIFGVILSIIILRESIFLSHVIGFLLVSVGVYVVNSES